MHIEGLARVERGCNKCRTALVLDLWMQPNWQPQWKPIVKELAALNTQGALNAELAAKVLERTKVLSCTR